MSGTLEWFGTTTFRLSINGLVIFLDTWLDRPDVLPKYLDIDDIVEADYIFISHAHFDHLPGADRIALRTGARVIANGEAIQHLRSAGVSEEQLIPVSGGERIPLFTKSVRDAAAAGDGDLAHGPPEAPAQPHHSRAVAEVHIWPSLHCLTPGATHADIPDVIDTGKVYEGEANQYVCTMDITVGMKYGLLKIGDLVSRDDMDAGMKSFVDYIDSSRAKPMSHFDGGQLSFNIILGPNKTVFWNGHLVAYDGILQTVKPKPDVLIQAIAGRANLNGRPYNGSAAEFAVAVSRWLGEPEKVFWCLHDDSPIKPWRVNVQPASKLLEASTKSEVVDLKAGGRYNLFEDA